MSKWYKNWFASEEYLEVYRHRNEKDAKNLINTILEETQLPKGSKILDAACGAGRHSILFHKKGYELTGFDLSKSLLKIGLKNSRILNYNINFLCSDIRSISLNTKFDLIVNLFTSFGYFEDDEENFSFIKNSKNLLNIDGYFILDFFNKNFLINNIVPESVKIENGKKYIEKRYISENRIIKEIKIINNEINRNYIESVKLYSSDELINKFLEFGFKIKSVKGDYKGSEFDKNKSERILIFAKL